MSSDLLESARLAIHQGKKDQARALLGRYLVEDPNCEQAWFLLAQVVEKPEQTVDCLKRVIRLNPNNQAAARALAVLKSGRTPSRQDLSATRMGSIQQDEFVDRPSAGSRSGHKPRNWPLILGSILVGFILILAIFGPMLAPRDPLEMARILRVGEKFVKAPFPLLTPGYPLGSDDLGRDMLSRLLYAVRPTMTIVLIVAAVRLVLGTIIGLGAGWSKGRVGHVLDSMIALAISIPVILVALGGIAAIGVEMGVWAFVFGLCLTGWVETARVVREQTRAVEKQEYVEAALALGASNTQVLFRHVLRQIAALLWMLFAFEISGTLMLTAALGFLGYYIGGDVWISVTDSAAEAISGMPELGQMLATIETTVIQPWPLIVIGAFVFLVVLAFNLLGEGLRRRTSLYAPHSRSAIARAVDRARLWADENLWWPLGNLARAPGLRAAGLVGLWLIFAGGFVYWRSQAAPVKNQASLTAAFPQAQWWAASGRDAYDTHWSQGIGPRDPVIEWVFEDRAGFVGGPVVSEDGSVYIASLASVLYALDPQGKVSWRVDLPATPVGTPALSQSGDVYLTDTAGGLARVSPQGEVRWHFLPEQAAPATTGPVVSPSGNIYYTQGIRIQAVSSEGKALWQVQPTADNPPTVSPRLSPDGDLLFVGNAILDAGDGSAVNLDALGAVDQYFVGADGEMYLVNGHEVSRWVRNGDQAEVVKTTSWEHGNFTTSRTSKQAGVAPDGLTWLFYTGFARSMGFGEDTRLVWLGSDGQLRGNVHYPTRNSQAIAVDQGAIVYACGNLDLGYGLPECQAFSPRMEAPLWKVALDESAVVAGGALIPGRLYVASREGFLYAIGAGKPLAPEVHTAATTKTSQSEKINWLDLANDPIGPQTAQARLFFQDEGGLVGGPAVSQDGTVFIPSKSGDLYALDTTGKVVWKATLPAPPVGAPVVGQDGTVYQVDKDGGLSAFDQQGGLLWHFQPQTASYGMDGPSVGPDGSIYYVVGNYAKGSIQAVSVEGKSLWLAPLKSNRFFLSPRASPDGEFVFFRGEVFDAQDGSAIDFALPFEVDEYIVGQDGRTYLRAKGTVVEWTHNGSEVELKEARVLADDPRPISAGVTSQGVVWLLYDDRVVWFARDGEALGAAHSEIWSRVLVGVDQDFTIYTCGHGAGYWSDPSCARLSPRSPDPIWRVRLTARSENLLGGTLAPGRVYFALEGGELFVIEGQS